MHLTDHQGINPTADRGCGNSRKAGGVYLECGLAPSGEGTPLSNYLTDPPVPYTAPSTQGMTIIEGPNGVQHLVDHIGAKHYPYASDYIEEGRNHGFSRRIPKNLDLSGLTTESRIIAVHPRGFLKNHDAAPVDQQLHRCANYLNTGDDTHFHTGQPCNRHQYILPAEALTNGQRALTADTVYSVTPADDSHELEYESAIIAQLPITGISVISTQDNSHADTLQRLHDMNLPMLVQESEK